MELSPTPRTRLTRSRERGATDRQELVDVLREAFIAHLGATVGEGEDAHPVVLPVAIAVDLDGPDEGGSLYLHGSVAAGWVGSVRDRTVCVTTTHLDGLVAARSGFHHSMNYRSAVVIGRCRVVEDAEERARALDAVVDHMVPGRAQSRAQHRTDPAGADDADGQSVHSWIQSSCRGTGRAPVCAAVTHR